MALNNLQSELDSIDLAPQNMPVEKFDKMIDFITEEQGIGMWGSIIQAIKLACVVGFIIARNILVQNAIADKKKKIDQLIRQRNQNSNEI